MTKSTSKLFREETPKEMKEDAMNLPEETKVKETTKKSSKSKLKENEEVANAIDDLAKRSEEPKDDVVDINLSAIQKKRFRINGDSSRILELNTSDLSIVSRMTSAYDRLVKHMDEVGNILSSLPDSGDDVTDDTQKLVASQLKAIDDEMRKEIDYIFDAPVSEVCGYGGSMYDPFEGMFRYEHIIDAISKLYETNLNNEFNKMRRRVSNKTSKYTKKYHN